LTHQDLDPDLWLEIESSGGPDKNLVYELSNTTVKNLWMTRIASTVGRSQSTSSTQTPEFAVMLDQQVEAHMAHLNEKFERFTNDYEELHRLVMEMRSQMNDICAPSNWHRVHPLIGTTVTTTTNLFLHLQSRLYFRFIVFECTNV
jgi:hypothetical protein